jgi:hypothetical protein
MSITRATIATIAIVGAFAALATIIVGGNELGYIAVSQANDPAAETSPAEGAVAPELHAVGIYEGYIKSDGQIHGSRANVVVDRPGEQVILSLSAYVPTTWLVEAKSGTTVTKVILGGYDRQVVKGLSADTVIIDAYRDESDRLVVPYAYDQESPEFRELVKVLFQETGTELSSFHGAYKARAGMPFIIDTVGQGEAKARMSPDYPRLTPVAELPNVKYSAILRQGGKNLHVNFTQAGPVIGPILTAPNGGTPIALDPERKLFYTVKGDDVIEVDPKTGSETLLDMGMDVPGLSWPCGITFDTARHQVLLASQGGEGFLYAYDTTTGAWSVVSSMNDVDLAALTYDAKSDVLYGLVAGSGRTRLKKFTTDGKFIEDILLTDPIMPGMVGSRHGNIGAQLIAAGDYLVLIADEMRDDRQVITRTFIIEASTGKALLARID